MAGLLDELGTYLAGAGIGLTLTTNLWLSQLPDMPDVAVALTEYPSMPPDEVGGGTGIPYKVNPRLQVMCRGVAHDYVGPRDLIMTVSAKLNAIANTTLSGTQYWRVVEIDTPALLERDSHDRCVMVQNFQVMKAPS